MGILGLEDEEFWSNPERTRADAVSALMRAETFGATLDGPKTADVAAYGSLPIAVIHVATEAQNYRMCFANEAILVAARLEDRATLAGRLTQGFRFEPQPDGRDDVIDGRMRIVDAVKRLRIPSKPARYLFAVIVRDTITERLEVEVGQSKLGYEDEAVSKFLAEYPPPPPPPVWPPPARPYPDYQGRADSPPVPDEPGIAVAAPRVVVLGRNRAVLRLSYRLKLLARDHVPHRDQLLPEQRGPAAVLPITLIINGSRDPGPVMLALQLPVEDDAIVDGEAVGYAALNLFDYHPLGVREETLFVWAFCGELMTGPTPIGVVAEESLPGRY